MRSLPVDALIQRGQVATLETLLGVKDVGECARATVRKEGGHLGEIAIREGVQAAVGAHAALLVQRDAHGQRGVVGGGSGHGTAQLREVR